MWHRLQSMGRGLIFASLLMAVLTAHPAAQAGEQRSFAAGSLIIPMDLAYQDHGMFQAYGLVFQLLRQGITVYWVIDPEKTWHAAPCDTPGDECTWDCAEEGNSPKCHYPTASPDFFAATEVVWDGDGNLESGDQITRHGYRGGPFVIDAADADTATPIIEAWNDASLWDENPWARRTVFHVVSVHEATAAFEGYVRKEMVAAPTIAVFSDGNENIATGYLRAAGIPQSNGLEFPAARCGADNCGPGTDNPDMLTVVSIMGDMGTCEAPNFDHRNGALFTEDGVPAYCQIMSMHWAVTDRETVQCEGGCPATQEQCQGQRFTYHGHEVVAEVREFLQFPTHFFAECQAVNAYENTLPNPDWPFLDDPERDGHFLTTTGNPPDCPCTDGDFECVVGGCDNGTRDCCLPRNDKELGAGFLIADAPNAQGLQILHPEIPYNQLDGAFETVGGSEPAYNLSTYLGTSYKNDMDVTFITGPDGPGDQDVWMTGYLDGVCDIGNDPDGSSSSDACALGKVSYLGGHSYGTGVPLSAHADGQGTRLFLNALFEADCVTTAGQPQLQLGWTGESAIGASTLPAGERMSLWYVNDGRGTALDARLTVTLPQGVQVSDQEPLGALPGDTVGWDIGSIGSGNASPPRRGSRWLDLSFAQYGEYTLEAVLEYRVGVSVLQLPPVSLTVRVAEDADGDSVPDDDDPFPEDAHRCGDSDQDGCDDCSQTGSRDPSNDGPDSDGDGRCDLASVDGGTSDTDGADTKGCSCRTPSPAARPSLLKLLLALL